jgi:uncharacterized RDD family membrane protein YckC
MDVLASERRWIRAPYGPELHFTGGRLRKKVFVFYRKEKFLTLAGTEGTKMAGNGLQERSPDFWGKNREFRDWPEVEFEADPAPPWPRITAAVLDSLLSEALGAAAMTLWKAPSVMNVDILDLLSGSASGVDLHRWGSWLTTILLVRLVVRGLYYAGCEGSPLQGTPGKVLMGMKVVDEGGDRISYARAFGRWMAKFLSWFSLTGILRVFWEPRRRMLHDSVAGTEVVLRRSS